MPSCICCAVISAMAVKKIGVIGATSLVGEALLSELEKDGFEIHAFSRKLVSKDTNFPNITWHLYSDILVSDESITEQISDWICLAPIWVISSHSSMLLNYKCKRIVCLSSTSRYTKADSASDNDRVVVRKLVTAENELTIWCEKNQISCLVLRPTLIYGASKDKNIASIASIIKKFGFFPLIGKADGLRQPIHLNDVAIACIKLLKMTVVENGFYNISGAETISYREMVTRVFQALGKRPIFLPLPRFVFVFMVSLFRFLPLFRGVSISMVDRMNQDMAFDHSKATQDFGFKPSPFILSSKDLDV